MESYDAIVVLGSEPDRATWKFPAHIYLALDEAARLLKKKVAPFIVVSGKHSLNFHYGDYDGLKQPFREADEMAEYLIGKGVPRKQILRERESIDTVGNFYYLKRDIFGPNRIRTCLLITTDFREPRLRYLWRKVMGSKHPLTLTLLKTGDKAIMAHESNVLASQKKWLDPIRDGDDAWFERTLAHPKYGRLV